MNISLPTKLEYGVRLSTTDRLYTREVVHTLIESSEEKIENNGAFATFYRERPKDIPMNVDLNQIAGIIQKIYLVGRRVWVDINLLSTPMGNIVTDLVDHVDLRVDLILRARVDEDNIVWNNGLIFVQGVITNE